jgi:hypothetical protein
VDPGRRHGRISPLWASHWSSRCRSAPEETVATVNSCVPPRRPGERRLDAACPAGPVIGADASAINDAGDQARFLIRPARRTSSTCSGSTTRGRGRGSRSRRSRQGISARRGSARSMTRATSRPPWGVRGVVAFGPPTGSPSRSVLSCHRPAGTVPSPPSGRSTRAGRSSPR